MTNHCLFFLLIDCTIRTSYGHKLIFVTSRLHETFTANIVKKRNLFDSEQLRNIYVSYVVIAVCNPFINLTRETEKGNCFMHNHWNFCNAWTIFFKHIYSVSYIHLVKFKFIALFKAAILLFNIQLHYCMCISTMCVCPITYDNIANGHINEYLVFKVFKYVDTYCTNSLVWLLGLHYTCTMSCVDKHS